MKILKNVLATLLATTLCFTSAFAATPSQGSLTVTYTENNSSLTLSGLSGGVEVYAMQLDLTVKGEGLGLHFVAASNVNAQMNQLAESGSTNITLLLDSETALNDGESLKIGTLTWNGTDFYNSTTKIGMKLLAEDLSVITYSKVSMAEGGASSGGSTGGSGGSGGGSGGGSSSSTTPTPQTQTNNGETLVTQEVVGTVSDNTVTATVSSEALVNSVNSAVAEAKENNSTATVEIKMTGTGAENGSILVPVDALQTLKTSTVEKLLFSMPNGVQMQLDKKAITAVIGTTTSGMVTVQVSQMDSSNLSDAQKNVIGNRPIYDFSIQLADKAVTQFGQGLLKLHIPYTLLAKENSNQVVAYYLPNDKSIEVQANSMHSDNTLTFTTNHLSTFAVGYQAVSFADMANHWASGTVDFVVARELFSGIADSEFGPNVNMTRAMFMTVLARYEGVNTGTGATWYEAGVNWAKENGISDGTNPNGSITREEMSAMLYRYMNFKGISLESTQTTTFSDDNSISDWAKQSVSAMQNAGMIGGVGDNKFAPQELANRASVAQIFKNMIGYVMK